MGSASSKTKMSSSSSPAKRSDNDFVGAFDAMALAGKPSTPTKPASLTKPSAQVRPGDRPFVGGFHPMLGARAPVQTGSPAFPTPNGPANANAIPSLPRPPLGMGVPNYGAPNQQSLTMRHALNMSPRTGRFSPEVDNDKLLPHTPSRPDVPSRIHSAEAITSTTSDSKAKPAVQVQPPATPKRVRANSSPPSPSPSSVNGGATVQCSGYTKAGKQCTRQVKTGMQAGMDPEDQPPKYCHQHMKEVLTNTGFYSRKTGSWVEFKDWIPDYLSDETQAALRVEMDKSPSAADKPGYIYTFEIRDNTKPKVIQLKVGRAVNVTKRVDQWSKQCGSKEQILRGFWPFSPEADNSTLMKGCFKPGPKGPLCHRLERLVHLELGDIAVNAQYLHPSFPSSASKKAISSTSASPRKVGPKQQEKACPDCGQYHKEIFGFIRPDRGRYQGKEWELLVKPVVEKWGAFVEALV